jgi:hypothetical protein
MEGRGRVLTEILCCHLPEESEKDHEITRAEWEVPWLRFEPCTARAEYEFRASPLRQHLRFECRMVPPYSAVDDLCQ